MQPVRWGILSTAKIGRTKVVPGLMKSPLCNVVAVASRDEANGPRHGGGARHPQGLRLL